jgi:AcrR family transcriptional regulator
MNLDSKSEVRPRPLRERFKEETAKAIAEAAEQVFADQGVRSARMEAIAEVAGVSVGTVYNHFEDRQALLADLIERRRKELAYRLDGALARSAKEPFEGQLREFVHTVFAHFEAHKKFLNIMLDCDHAAITSPSPAMKEIRARAETLARRGLTRKALRPALARLLPALLWGSIKSMLLHDLKYPGELSVDERAAAAIDFFLNGARA